MPSLVSRPAPNFSVDAIVGTETRSISLASYRNKKYVALFFYPGDFTTVCNSELHAIQERLADFQSRNVEVLASSPETKFTHITWLATPKDSGGVQGVKFPLIADEAKTLIQSFDIVAADGSSLRALFIIDLNGIVRHATIYEASVGRNVDEALRTIDAIQTVDKHRHFCPANWAPGAPTLTSSIMAILRRNENKPR